MESEQEVVAYLGPPASYTHQAARTAFPHASHLLKPYPTIATVFTAVQSGEVKHGVVPFENSTYGPVVTTLDLFSRALNQEPKPCAKPQSDTDEPLPQLKTYGDIIACRDVFVHVQHCLLGRLQHPPTSSTTTSSPTIPPPTPSLTHLTQILSHEQALGQCSHFLTTQLPSTTTKKEVSSTSRAAELAAEDPSGTTAAISSELAAEVYGLDVLRKGIQDREDNVTRFFVIETAGVEQEVIRGGKDVGAFNGNVPGKEEDTTHRSDQRSGGISKSTYKSLIIFTVSHTSPGALADSLAVFKNHDVNLTSINTRPSGLRPWHYFFFVEVEVGVEVGAAATGREEIDDALRDLEGVAESWRRLGGWESVDG